MDMKVVWKQKIDEIDDMIRNTSLFCDGRIYQLLKKKHLLQDAFNRVGEWGDSSWATQFISWAEDCGFKIKEDK